MYISVAGQYEPVRVTGFDDLIVMILCYSQ